MGRTVRTVAAARTMNGRLLVFNCHEPWVYQLRSLAQPLDIIADLPGRHMRGWDHSLRPFPPNARVISLAAAQQSSSIYDCIIAHNLTDLLDVKALPGPRLLVIHLALSGMLVEQASHTTPGAFRSALAEYIHQTAAHVVAVSQLKGKSWGFAEDIVLLSAAEKDYLPWEGDFPRGLRISNFIQRRANTLLWTFHQQAFANVPVTLVGHNPEIPGATASRDWNDLKRILRHHRFFIHTAHRDLEDGYNMATLEAMAAGLPVLGNVHPTSPIANGVSGFLSDDPQALASYARLLLADRELARTMGRAAQIRVEEYFSEQAFRSGILRAISKAQEVWESSRVPCAV
jgi:Glycosyl transferases group 1